MYILSEDGNILLLPGGDMRVMFDESSSHVQVIFNPGQAIMWERGDPNSFNKEAHDENVKTGQAVLKLIAYERATGANAFDISTMEDHDIDAWWKVACPRWRPQCTLNSAPISGRDCP